MARYKVYKNQANGYTEKVKEGFNWLVFLFGPFWYFFNGMVGKGFLWLGIAILTGPVTYGIGAAIVWIVAGAKANSEKETKYLQDGWTFIGYEGEINNN